MNKSLFWMLGLVGLMACGSGAPGGGATPSGSTPNNGSPPIDDGRAGTTSLGKTLLGPSDLHYLGAFRLPRVGGGASDFGYGGWGGALNPDGDNTPDGYPGSLYIVGRFNRQMVAEVNIPAPKDPRSVGVAGLNTASFIQPFADITEGKAEVLDRGDGFRLNGLAYLPAQAGQTSAKIYWTARVYYNLSFANDTSHGMSDTNLAAPHAKGRWRLKNFHNLMTSGYILTIPEPFANTYLGGKRLASGMMVQQGVSQTSAGPSFFAYAPWQDDPTGVGPADGASLNDVPLLYYPYNNLTETGERINDHDSWVTEGQSNFPEFQIPDRWDSAIWVDTATMHGVLVFGQRADGRTYYGDARPGDCTIYKGYHGEPYHPSVVFYDPGDFAKAAQGTKDPTTIIPYIEWNPGDLVTNTCVYEFNGAGFDPTGRLIYLIEQNADTVDGEPQPLVHMFKMGE